MSSGEMIKVGGNELIFNVDPMTRGEIDTQVATAKRYPRSITRFKETALALATDSAEVAASCHYSVPRGGKDIQGPSIRLAEIVYYAWGNLRTSASIVEEGDTSVTVRGSVWDLETNNAVSREVRRSIFGKHGRFNPDMITVTVNAAMAIAIRNAIFTAIPRSFVNGIYDQAYKVAFGNATTFKQTLHKMIEHYSKIGVTPDRLVASVGKQGVDDITMEDVAHLRGIFNNIRDSNITIDEAFPVEKPETKDADKTKEKPKTKTDEMAERFGATKKKVEPKADVGTPSGDEIASKILDDIQAATDVGRLGEIRGEVGELLVDKVLTQLQRDDLIGFIDARVTEIEGK